jgi:hypothetical protein
MGKWLDFKKPAYNTDGIINKLPALRGRLSWFLHFAPAPLTDFLIAYTATPPSLPFGGQSAPVPAKKQ